MSKVAIAKLDDIQDILGDYPGDMKPLKNALGTSQVAMTYRRMPKHTGAKGSYGHRHATQEEIIYVISGTVQVKADREVHEVRERSAVRIPAGVTQGTWNEGPKDAEILIISTRMEPEDKVEYEQQFWPN